MQENQFHIYPADEQHCEIITEIIVDAFKPVAQRFALTRENCPKHPSNYTTAWTAADFKRGVIYFILETKGVPVGCVGLEIAENAVCYLERLAVHPSHQNKGAGQKLVAHIVEAAREKGMQTISIGIIASDHRLNSWYIDQGFVPGPCKHFNHLPFEVQFMFRSLKIE